MDIYLYPLLGDGPSELSALRPEQQDDWSQGNPVAFASAKAVSS